MKRIISIMLAILIPTVMFAQEYNLILKGMRRPMKCRIVGTYNDNLYYSTKMEDLVVVPYSKVEYVYEGKKDVTDSVLHSEAMPFEADIVSLFPNLDELEIETSELNEARIRQAYLNELTQLRRSNKLIAGILGFTLVVSIVEYIVAYIKDQRKAES